VKGENEHFTIPDLPFQLASVQIKAADLNLYHTQIGDLKPCSTGLLDVNSLAVCYCDNLTEHKTQSMNCTA
jgi:hypothetical protein